MPPRAVSLHAAPRPYPGSWAGVGGWGGSPNNMEKYTLGKETDSTSQREQVQASQLMIKAESFQEG